MVERRFWYPTPHVINCNHHIDHLEVQLDLFLCWWSEPQMGLTMLYEHSVGSQASDSLIISLHLSKYLSPRNWSWPLYGTLSLKRIVFTAKFYIYKIFIAIKLLIDDKGVVLMLFIDNGNVSTRLARNRTLDLFFFFKKNINYKSDHLL